MRATAFAIVFILGQINPVYAQSNATSVEELKPSDPPAEIKVKAPEEERKVERVQVTGSHIKRIDVEGASPVQTINKKDLEKTGYNSVSDVLRDTSANSFGSLREDSGSNAAGVAHVDLRGLGSSNTLVLLNGRRLPTDAVTGAVDLNLIPMAAIERVEVLKDGASALYGSDALAGVVNIITRKDFKGTEVSITQTTPQLEGGLKRDISITNGINKGKLSMVNVVQVRDNGLINSRDRDWTNKGESSIGSRAGYKNAGGQWMIDPSCPPSAIRDTPSGKVCAYKFSDFSTELPELQQYSFLNETSYELNSRVRLRGSASGTQKQVKWSFAPAPDTFTIPAAVADKLGPGGTPLPGATPGQDLQVRYRLAPLGTRDTEVSTSAYSLGAGSVVDIGDGWEADINVGHNRVENKDNGVNGYALVSKVQSLIADGSFNPFDESTYGTLNTARYKPLEQTTSELSSLDMKVAGSLAEISTGSLGLAVGANFTFQKYTDKFDAESVAGNVYGNAGSSGGGQRDTKAVFSELSVPITQKLEMQIAGRYDKYSDFGDTFNPKAGLTYKPSKSLLLRASAGTGFKAPLMQDLYAAKSQGFPTFIDRSACNAEKAAGGATPSCLPQQYPVESSGNSGLKEQRSESYTVGAIFEPNRDFNIGTDLFMAKMKNVVGIDYNDAMDAEAAGINLANQGVIVTRDPVTGYIENIVAPLQNLSSQEIAGIDVAMSYRIWKMRLGVDHSQMLYFKEQGFPGTPFRNKLGENGRPPWRNVLSAGYTANERHNLTASALTTAGQMKAVKEEGRLPNYTTYDLQYSYDTKKIGTFTAGVKNVFGSTPPLDDTNPNGLLNNAIYDQIGRQYFTGYKATF